MKIPRALHSWSVSPKRAATIQKELAARVIRVGSLPNIKLVAGADLAFSPDRTKCVAGVVIWDMRTNTVVEQRVAVRPVRFPYVPGLLSFREAPAVLAAIRMIRMQPDVFMFDGQGYAHPRRFGLACHLGVQIDRPSIGCAKSVLIGRYRNLARAKGSTAPMIDNHERVALALRSRDSVKPVYVSVGHLLSLEAAAKITLACCTRFRLPEPTRLADKLVTEERLFL